MLNPHLEESLDYLTLDFKETCLIFTVEGRTDEQATVVLRNIWLFNNAKDIEVWNRQQEEDLAERWHQQEQAELDDEQQCILHKEEAKQAKQEEWKKYKNKFALIPDQLLLSTALLLPSQHTLNKLCKGDYISLYFFINKGLWKADKDGSDDDNPLMLVQMDKGPTFQSATVAKVKKHRVKDKHLSWEEFSQANYCMLNTMKQQDWPEEWVAMVRDFWIALKLYQWRHNVSDSHKKALLLYQGKVCRGWHKTLSTTEAFHLLPLCMDHLQEYHQEILDNTYVEKIDAIQMVCITLTHVPIPPFFFLSSPPLPFVFVFSLCSLALPSSIHRYPPMWTLPGMWAMCSASPCPNVSFLAQCVTTSPAPIPPLLPLT